MWTVRELRALCTAKFAMRVLTEETDCGNQEFTSPSHFHVSVIAVRCNTFNPTRVLHSTGGHEAATETVCNDITSQ